MATLQAHGKEVGRIAYLLKTKAYMGDGVVLVNHGQGWKVSGKLKAGIAPLNAYRKARGAQSKALQEHPAFAAYREALFAAACLAKRHRLHTMIEIMYDDPDGVWSEACDGYGDNLCLDQEEVIELCQRYKRARDENQTCAVAD